MLLAEEAVKGDGIVESFLSKTSAYLRSVYPDDLPATMSTLCVEEQPIMEYVNEFNWQGLRFRSNVNLRDTLKEIVLEITQAEVSMKARFNTYTQAKNAVKALDRKASGNLSVRSLVGIVQREHVLPESEFMANVYVAVPKSLYLQFKNSYETLCAMVVPRSARLVAEDKEFGLYTVVVFHKHRQEFEKNCRERRFVIRDFQFSDKSQEQNQQESVELVNQEKEQWSLVTRLLKGNYALGVVCLVHTRVIRMIAESVLRYGVPPDYMCLMLTVKPKCEKKARDVLLRVFSSKAESKNKNLELQLEELSIAAGIDKEFLPFVLVPLEIKV